MKKTIIDAVIPVYHPGNEFEQLICRLENQSVEIRKIYLMHTIDGVNFESMQWMRQYQNIEEVNVFPTEYDHGGTRDRGVNLSDAEYVLCMTQDAIPKDEYLVERLLEGFKEAVAVSYARQLPRKDCKLIEKYIRNYNYPDKSIVKSKENMDRMGVKTFFCSNVCALYKMDIYQKRGGFEKKTIFNEDMIYAAGCIMDSYKISYVADARVIHSHNYTNLQQFKRNFDLAVSQADHPEIFASVKSEKEGIRMVMNISVFLMKQKKPFLIVSLFASSAAKYLGYFLGKRYKRIPENLLKHFTSNPRYWGE